MRYYAIDMFDEDGNLIHNAILTKQEWFAMSNNYHTCRVTDVLREDDIRGMTLSDRGLAHLEN